ncbi:fused MFS/spermidine synthase [Legionella quateirensis]|uniref:Spermidine synthase n=1 Tax=Legionella quateirensis TaxID=45072 RepID=A0A378KZC6_9GAMM|nr:fused MFS/spermidine synthase [Legionella quateirensis]KTD46490.1 spermidine synthase [Legionella quateirensis]STY18728.1 spermidine synthase [Legionella quateirensis]
MLRFLFPVSLFLSAVLLFSIQPMVAKTILPVYGGTPAVWTVCMLFFQGILLVSYGYVWLLSFLNRSLLWRLVHTVLIVLSIIAIPLLFQPAEMAGYPEWDILYDLLSQLGLPLLIIGASAPLLQFAYSQTSSKGASDPYYLYIASNLGSLITLLIYPWVIERVWGITHQFHLWSIGYLAYLLLLLFVLYSARYKPLEHQRADTKALPWRSMLYWVFLSFIPCSLMLGVTLYISTDVAATPLFWVLPLALYLLTFVVTFTTKPLISNDWIKRNCIFFLVFTILGYILKANQVHVWQVILANLASFFVLALLCHGQLFQRRPEAKLLTLFYFCLALGGVLAGLFNGILAAHLFNQIYEYPLAILLSLFVLPLSNYSKDWWVPLVVTCLLLLHYFIPQINWYAGFSTFQVTAILALIVIVVGYKSKVSLILSLFILFAFLYSPIFFDKNILLQQRNFFGVKQVLVKENTHVLVSQSTVHGFQLLGEKKPISGFRAYYGAIKPVVEDMQKEFHSMSVTILGLGAGTMVCQFRETDQLTVIEIDQQVIDLAENPKLFTYLRDCSPSVKIIRDDGRLALNKIPDGSQQLIILDAFNSDAIPVHLMTLEAFTLYKKKLKDDGVILVNLSNRHLHLLPVVNSVSRSLDMMLLNLVHKGDPKLGQFDSEWALLTMNQPLALQLMKGTGWRFVSDNNQFLWTDDYSNLIPMLKW